MTVAVVTGASRGIGRGIALSLGETGATVYVTGRTMRGAQPPVDGAPGTIDDTAEQVDERGGHGIAVRCDHSDYSDVQALLGRVATDNDGKLDVLVNAAWGGYELYDHAGFAAPFWEQDFETKWNGMFVAGLRPTLASAHAAIPLLLRSDRGLIVNIAAWDRGRYLGALTYDTAKAAIVRATQTMAHELRPHGVSVVAVFPGFTGTERVKMAGATGLESPEYTGRCVAALMSDPDIARRSGGGYRAGELARDYNVSDIDGSQPEPFDLPDELILIPPPDLPNSGEKRAP